MRGRSLLLALLATSGISCSSSSSDGAGATLEAGAAGGGSGTEGGNSAGGAGTGGGPTLAACLGNEGTVAEVHRDCTTDDDCETLTVRTCCGSDRVAGIRKGTECSLSTPDCTGLGCPKFMYPEADDGRTTESGGSIEAQCMRPMNATLGQCETVVVPHVPDAGSTACGTVSCTPAEVCVHPPTSVGGAGPQCLPPNDGGSCPPGTRFEDWCSGGLGGCVEIYVPPPPSCATIPLACVSAPDCDCLGRDICGGGADFCGTVTGHDVTCINLAP